MNIERYIGGGKIFLSKYNGTDYDAEVEIGEIQSGLLKISQTYVDALSRDTGIAKKVDKVATSTDATFAFSTQNMNNANLAMAMFGAAAETETFAISDPLPDGTVATEETILPVINAATFSKFEAKIKVVGVNVSGSENPILVIHHAVITPSGDIRDYFADKHSVLSFDAEILEVADGYFKEYFMPVA